MLIRYVEAWLAQTEQLRSLRLLQADYKTAQKINIIVHPFSFYSLVCPVEILLETI